MGTGQLNDPVGVAVDSIGNVYITDGSNGVRVVNSSGYMSTLTNSKNYGSAEGGYVDLASGNFYFTTGGGGSLGGSQGNVVVYNATSKNLTALVSSGLYYPWGVGLDSLGNVYFADTFNDALKVLNKTTSTVSTLSTTADHLYGLAVDTAGNVFFGISYNTNPATSSVLVWNATTKSTSTFLSGFQNINGMSFDTVGNLFIADYNANTIYVWNFKTNNVSTYLSGLNAVADVAFDTAGNLYYCERRNFGNPPGNVVVKKYYV